AAYPLGRAGGLLGRAADGDLLGRLLAGRVFLVVERFLPDPLVPPLGLHDRLLDALGLGSCLVDADSRGCWTGRSILVESGTGSPGCPRPFPACLSDRVRRRLDGSVVHRRPWENSHSSELSCSSTCLLKVTQGRGSSTGPGYGVSLGSASALADGEVGKACCRSARF